MIWDIETADQIWVWPLKMWGRWCGERQLGLVGQNNRWVLVHWYRAGGYLAMPLGRGTF